MLQTLFLRCFEEGYQHPHRRPDAVMWRNALQDAESSLTSCQVNSQHLFSSHLPACPWCERSVQQSIDSFPLSVRQHIPTVSSQQRLAALNPSPAAIQIPQLQPQHNQQPTRHVFSLWEVVKFVWKVARFIVSYEFGSKNNQQIMIGRLSFLQTIKTAIVFCFLPLLTLVLAAFLAQLVLLLIAWLFSHI